MTATQLKSILDTVRQQKDLRPQVDAEGHVLRTFCNLGLDRILGLYGAPRMVNRLNSQPLMANDMIDFMRSSTRWERVDGSVACARASQGVLVVAAKGSDTANGHGHVAAVYPAPAEMSGSWGKEVPMLNNIGRPFKPKPPFSEEDLKNRVLKASQCFRTEPEYFSIKIQGVGA